MPSLIIPESGLAIGGTSSKNGSFSTEMLGLTLADSVIEEMIRCVQNRKPIQLSLGVSPSISYGSKTQHLSTSDDPFTTDLFSADLSRASIAPSNTSKKEKTLCSMFGMVSKRLVPVSAPPKPQIKTPSVSIPIVSETAGSDAAVAALQNSLASENARKVENSTKLVKDGSLGLPGKKGGKQTNKSKFLSQNRSLHDTTRSMPSSPALSSAGSPALGPTSAPLSQQQAEQAKASRKPVIHLLAVQPWTEAALRDEIPDSSHKDLKDALQKVGDLNEATGKWELRRNFFKELDVWNFQYSQANDRQRAIDNAVKTFDKLRLGISAPEWERLLPKNERGTGKCLSKLQAKIAAGPPPKINASKAPDSGRDTSNGEDEDSPSDKHASRAKGGESMARSVSQPLANKPKKTSEKEAQAKRLLSKKPAMPKPVTKPGPAKKALASKPGAKVLSSEYVHDSDEDDSSAPAKPLPKVMQKRPRKDEDVESSDSSIPLSKKIKKDVPLSHRVSDASQASRTTTNSSNSSAASSKTKSNSPQKSSPLASSPPTNATDIEDQSSGERTSSSASPPHVPTKNSRSPIHKRHGKTSSVSSSNSSSSRYLKQEVTDLARRYRLYYPKYEALHRELSGMNGQRDKQKERNLLEMHARLEAMKKEILAGIVDGDSS